MSYPLYIIIVDEIIGRLQINEGLEMKRVIYESITISGFVLKINSLS